jgi:predicted HAD superfamily Cof-like phosphohydrolase
MQVRNFFKIANQDIPTFPGLRDVKFRLSLIEEETKEVLDAANSGDFLDAIDGICDLLYVTLGAAVAWGIDIEPFFDEVHESNMRKIDGPKDPETGKLLKPEGWVPPNLKDILDYQIEAYKVVSKTGKTPTYEDMYVFNQLKRVSTMFAPIDIDEYAIAVRDEWASYAKQTIGEKAPSGFTKPWSKTGEWGREGNRRVVKKLLEMLIGRVLQYEQGLSVPNVRQGSESRRSEDESQVSKQLKLPF